MEQDPKLPVAISYIGSKYLIFDINAVTWLRKAHHICGVMGGTLPQAPSQNIFLGLPMQIMPEEAQLLVERGVGYIVDDSKIHEQTLENGGTLHQEAYAARLRHKGEQISVLRDEERRELSRLSHGKSRGRSKSKKESPAVATEPLNPTTEHSKESQDAQKEDVSLFDSSTPQQPQQSTPQPDLQPHGIIPTTSDLWLPTPPSSLTRSENAALLPNVPPSYALYRHLNSKSYFMTPGLRFGCQYSVYPGDPLRFHSHFLAVGKEWDEEIDLMDIVGGGRLGTGVKKGFLIGGAEPSSSDGTQRDRGQEPKVRTFSVEWAAM